MSPSKIPEFLTVGLAVLVPGLTETVSTGAQVVDAKASCDFTKDGLKWSNALRMNQIQVVGTHNSYHLESPIKEKEAQAQLIKDPVQFYYSHPQLDIQLEYQHIRNLEIDVFADPDGGHYAKPLVKQWSGLPLPPQEVMNKPGVKVLHIADADVNTQCHTFIECLTIMKKWSEAHPKHVPIPIMIEFKTTDRTITAKGGVDAIPWNNTALLDGFDKEIRAVFSPSQLISPDSLRRGNLTLEKSVLKYGWPDLDSARGRFFFLMDQSPGPIRDAYTEGRPNLEGRAIFTNSVPGNSDCAFQKLNEPLGEDNLANIQKQVAAGYWVRTRSDVTYSNLLGNDTTAMREAAFKSGAQIVSTDFPVYGISSRFNVDYAVFLEGRKSARCNPVNAPESCKALELEPAEYVRN